MVLTILLSSMMITRRRDFQIFGAQKNSGYRYSLLDEPDSAISSTEFLLSRYHDESDSQETLQTVKHSPKCRPCCGTVVYTPNTSRFADHLHSRILQKFPFLIEMFYWIVTYIFYRMTKILSEQIFSESIWDVAQDHGLEVLDFQQFGWLSFLFPCREHDVQQWFMYGHQTALTVLNRAYALIHLPGTVGWVKNLPSTVNRELTGSPSFIAWYYYVAPSHKTFTAIRRTLTLTNFFAFLTFTLYPCMPPRLLPPEYGFLDSVRHDNATSVWMSGNYVNSLAAMPSMHFGYAFVIGCTMIYHSGMFRSTLEKGEVRKSLGWKGFYVLMGLGYPSMILVTIIATANHYWLDAFVAIIVASLAYLCNSIFLTLLPLEDLLLWLLRVEKPVPSTGDRFRQWGGRL